jgi:23S rRNA pseudouridine1911/1915/1917 synthase
MSVERGSDGPAEQDEIISTNAGLILPGGKVNPEAIQRALDESGSTDDDGALRRVVFELRRDLKSRLDKYLTTRITFMSRNQLQRLIDEGGVTVNGRQPKASTVLRAGDVIEVVVPPPPSGVIRPEEIPLDVLYEDTHLIVLNKAPDIIVHPARSENSGTMINALAWHFRNRSESGGELSTVGNEFARPGVVHRLDRHTSGCIVFAKDDEAHWKLGHQFEHRRVDKRYLAVVQGKVEPIVDVIEAPIGPHPSREKGYREKYVVRHDELGKPSVTICRVRERYRLHERPVGDQHFSLVELELKTGRTHQIRVHLSHLGYPIVGDDMYGGRPFVDRDGRTIIARQALHAATLGFSHPITGEPMKFTSPLRGDMGELVRALRACGEHETLDPPGSTVEIRV